MPKFITSKRTLEFTNHQTQERFLIPNHYLGEVPDWVTLQWPFKAAVKDATITFVGQSDSPASPASVDYELLELREQAKALDIPRAGQLGKEKLKAAIAEKKNIPPEDPAGENENEETEGESSGSGQP